MTTKLRIAGGAFAVAMLAIVTVVLFSGSVTTIADPPGGAFCGGIAGIPCSEGCVCVDDPRDDCNPKRGGADCGGICRPAPSSPPNQDCSGGGSESITDGSFANCDPTTEPGVGENPSCVEAYTCTRDGVWLCINSDGTQNPAYAVRPQPDCGPSREWNCVIPGCPDCPEILFDGTICEKRQFEKATGRVCSPA
jgi:hypothetical protein